MKLKLEIASLEKYWEKRIIPRGLRIMLKSATDKDDEDFNTVWDRILDHCSFELMNHIICKRKRMLAVLDEEINEIKEILSPHLALPECIQLMEKIEKKLSSLFEETVSTKKRKFDRDQEDFRENKVRSYKRNQNERSFKSSPRSNKYYAPRNLRNHKTIYAPENPLEHNYIRRGELQPKQYTPQRVNSSEWTTVTHKKRNNLYRKNPYRPQGKYDSETPRASNQTKNWRSYNKFDVLHTEETDRVGAKENYTQSNDHFLGPRSQYFNQNYREPPQINIRKRPFLEDVGGARDITREKKMKR
ncbi:Hypothetical predicted protein [Pelobates cultripes]|uniref:Uncharacterized protein n=1 Tax=Pelobates cultripes TaxID=61616 RepID=A0AAD1WFK8_PELCU|nr:Hypothetical predicted protein [Pelobates cultripes]